MFALLVFRILIAIVSIAVIVTQVIIPLVSGTILFPALRKTRQVLLEEKAEVIAQIDDVDLKSNVISLKAKLAEKQAALQPKSVESAPSQPEQKS